MAGEEPVSYNFRISDSELRIANLKLRIVVFYRTDDKIVPYFALSSQTQFAVRISQFAFFTQSQMPCEQQPD